jgi:hypothetical protein
VKAHEIYRQISPDLLKQMLDWFRDHDRNVYRSALASLAQTRKLRLVFIQKKPLPDQYAWIAKTLKAPSSDSIGEHLLQAWLMSAQQDLLVAFCDGVGIEHDGKGAVTGELPPEFEEEKVRQTVEGMLEASDPHLVALYLTVFNAQQPGGWAAVSSVLESDERLKLG